jgi:hypothetical protein
MRLRVRSIELVSQSAECYVLQLKHGDELSRADYREKYEKGKIIPPFLEGLFIIHKLILMLPEEFFEPTLFHLASLRLEECLIEFLLISRELGRSIDLDMEEEISSATFAIQSFHPFITKCDDRPMLCP